MITAELNYRTVTFRGNGVANSTEMLRRIYRATQSLKIGAGSVGIMEGEKVGEGTQVHVSVIDNCNRQGVDRILKKAGISENGVEFVDIPFED